MYYTTSSGRIELRLTPYQARTGSHPGPCDADIARLRKVPEIAGQLAALDPALVRAELAEWGAWDDAERAERELKGGARHA